MCLTLTPFPASCPAVLQMTLAFSLLPQNSKCLPIPPRGFCTRHAFCLQCPPIPYLPGPLCLLCPWRLCLHLHFTACKGCLWDVIKLAKHNRSNRIVQYKLEGWQRKIFVSVSRWSFIKKCRPWGSSQVAEVVFVFLFSPVESTRQQPSSRTS